MPDTRDDTKEAVLELQRYRYEKPDSDWKIAEMKWIEDLHGKMQANSYGEVIVKGNMSLMPNVKYIIEAEEVNNSTYGLQYDLVMSRRKDAVETMSPEEFRQFMRTITSDNNVDNIYDMFDNPKELLEAGDTDSLMKVKGIGEKTAEGILETYQSQKDYSPAYVKFGEFGFTQRTTQKIVTLLHGVEEAINTLERNPYELMKLPNLGFKSIDGKALANGMRVNDNRRVRAFIQDYFDQQANDGNSWVLQTQLYAYLSQEIHNVDMKYVAKWITSSDNFTIFKRDGEVCVADHKRYETEKNIARELIRLLNHPAQYELDGIEETIQEVQSEQGFDYSEEQYSAIKTMLSQNVFILQGYAGTGKSTAIKAVAKIFKNNNLSLKQCALSGKAADNLTQITGTKGETIHRLLGWGRDATRPGKFAYYEKNQLPAHIIILDEISMVDVDVFYALLKAIRNGSKLIMIGDEAQLDSIGVGVMSGMLKSGIVPTQTLTQIHRQALESAIISHSMQFRQGHYPKGLTTNDDGKLKVYGDKHDLGYQFIPREAEKKIQFNVASLFNTGLKHFDVSDIQVITPTIKAGATNCQQLNEICQKVANPPSSSKNEYHIKRGKGYEVTFREGDKVINTQNNRGTFNSDHNLTPIYNGNTGIIKKIDLDDLDGTIMRIYFDGIGLIHIKKRDIKNIDLGYCMTVHKSQGSTIPFVIVALPFQFKLNSRELLYTAITRASKRAFIITSNKTLAATVRKTSSVTHHNNLDVLIKIANKQYQESED